MRARCSLETEPWWALAMIVPAPLLCPDWAITWAGGPAAAAVIGSSALGLLGAGLGLAAVHLAAVPWGSWTALGLGLAIAVLWNLILLGLARRAAP